MMKWINFYFPFFIEKIDWFLNEEEGSGDSENEEDSQENQGLIEVVKNSTDTEDPSTTPNSKTIRLICPPNKSGIQNKVS